MHIIVAEHLSKQFPGEQRMAVANVSFAIDPGELIVILGPSGCGKTTLLKMINRLYEPTAGQLLVDGVDVRSLPATMLRRRIGYAIQQTGLFPHLRVEQNIAVVPRLLGWERQRIENRIDTLLDLVGLPRLYRRRYPNQLSGGEQQRVGLARALAADPAIMLMDEPFGALDALTRTRLQDELLDIQRQLHKTILFVTHDVEEALRLADRIMVMREGTLVQFDTPLNILNHPNDSFVRQITGADDVLRHLSLIPVGLAVQLGVPPENPLVPPLSPHENLRVALTRMLAAHSESLPVQQDGQIIGWISLNTLRQYIPAPEQL